MSLLLDDPSSSSSSSSPRDCSKRGGLSHGVRSRLISRRLLLLLSTPLLSLLFLLLLLWLILRPSAPQFSLRDAAALLLPPPSSPSSADPLAAAAAPAAAAVTAVVAARNPNAHVGAFYDRLRVRAACAGEPPAAEAAVPGFYQEPRAVSTLSAVVGPAAVRGPQRTRLLIEIRLAGRLRWKVGMWVSRGYEFEVDCLAVVDVGPAGGTSVPLSQCSTNI